MRATGSIQNIMETTLETIKGSIDANTIIGDPIKTDTTVVVPISKGYYRFWNWWRRIF